MEEKPKFSYDSANIFNDFTLSWTYPMLKFWTKNKPSPENLLEIPNRLKIESTLERLEKAWEKENKKKKPNFPRCFYRVIAWDFWQDALIGIFGYNLGLIQAVLVIYLVKYIQDNDAPIYEGAGYIIAYSITGLVSYYCWALATFRINTLAMRIKSIIPMLLYKKILNVSNLTLSQGNNRGKLANIIASEIDFFDSIVLFLFLVATPLFLFGSFFILGFNIGAAGVIGLLIIILHYPAILFFGNLVGKWRLKTSIFTDRRIKMIGNLIEGIRIIKLYGWEHPYLDLIIKQRDNEIRQNLTKNRFSSINKMMGTAGIGLVLFLTFLIHIKLGNTLTPGDVFSTVTLLLMNHQLINNIGANCVVLFFILYGSLKRINDALVMKNKEEFVIDSDDEFSVIANDLELSWKEKSRDQDIETTLNKDDSVVLCNLNFKLRKGELLVVIGPVGSGKSTLLMGLLQEISIAGGELKISQKPSYSGEDPWIISGTIRDNILMGLEYDESYYNEVLLLTSLKKDIDLFKFGDLTVVGDRGITLSGGQKARLSLARAVYTKRDIVLLDDPLSAVDAEVSANIFQNCIRNHLNDKTVVLATHQIHVISEADKILVIDNGRQLFFGNYEELQKRDDVFHIVGKLMNQDTEEQIPQKRPKVNENNKTVEEKDKLTIQEEERAEGSVPFSVYHRFLVYGVGTCLLIPLLFLLLLAVQANYIAIVWWLSIWAKSDDQESDYYITVFGVMIIIFYISAFFRAYLMNLWMLYGAKRYHNMALKCMTLASTVFFDKNPSGRMLNRFSKDTLLMDEILIIFWYELIQSSFLLLGNIVVLAIVAPPNIAVILIFAFYVVFLIKKLVPISKDLRRIELTSKSPILTLCESSVHGLITIRALDSQQKFIEDMKSAVFNNTKTMFSYQLILRFYQSYTELGSVFVNILNVIILICYKDYINESQAAMSISLTISMNTIFSYWAKTLVEVENLMASPQRLIEYSEIPQEGDFLTDSKFIIDKGRLEFRNVYMRYRDNFPYALQNLNLVIESGEKVGIIGRTGAGKSTIMQVLFRLTNPASGTILIDNQNYMTAGLHQLRKQMSVIPQSPTIFIASCRDNLDPFHEHSEEEITEVLQQTRLMDLVNSFPKGIDTILIGESGNLSAGQKQLVCLARALIRKNKIVMMDEATANVDPETDRFIQDKIQNMFKDSTVLIVAHRLRTIINADKIIVMDEGAAKEIGSPKTLGFDEDSLFRKMIMHTGNYESNYLLSKLS